MAASAAARCVSFSSPRRKPLRGTMVTGRLDQEGFLALLNSRSVLVRCPASSVAKNALVLATALATKGSSRAELCDEYAAKASNARHASADTTFVARLRLAR